MKSQIKVGVLMGGLSSERQVSLKTGKAVLAALQARGWDAVAIDVDRDLAGAIRREGIDVAWLALHGRYGEDGCVQGLLELLDVPYTGSGVRASAVAMDKIATKRILRGVEGLVMARDAVLRPGDPTPDLPLPVICKPAVGGSTIGMRFVRDPSEWEEVLAEAFAEHHEVLVEEVITGDELTVAVLEGEALPVIRIVPDSGFFDFEAKYTDGATRYEVPAAIDADLAARAQAAAVAAYRELGCRGLARADFLVRADGAPVFLEINTLPGMTATSLSPMAARASGVSFEVLVERLLLGACTDGGSGLKTRDAGSRVD